MTNAAVTELNSYILNVSSGNANAKNTGIDNFKQAMQNAAIKPASKKQEESSADKSSMMDNYKTDDVKAEQAEMKDVLKNLKKEFDDAFEMTAKDSNQLSKEDEQSLLQAMSEFATMLQDLLTQTFDVTPEELQDAMKELNISSTDLLDVNQLKELAVSISGSTDSMQLLTDESLYQKINSVIQQAMQELSQISEEFGLPTKEIEDICKQLGMQNEAADMVLQNPEETKPQDGILDGERMLNQTSDKSNESSETIVQVTDSTKETVNKLSESSTQNEDSQQMSQNQESTFQTVAETKSNFQATDTTLIQQTEVLEKTEDIMRQITEYIKVSIKPKMTEINMQLQPENLGSVHVQLLAKEGVVTAQFTAQNETVKAAIESQLITLKENFEQQGIKVEEISVTIESHGFENRNQGQNSNGSGDIDHAKKVQIRRLNLADADILEELSKEEQIAVDMMAMNGNTVDYTV